jgi:peroxiredoxin
MKDFSFSILKNNEVQQITFRDLALNKRVLVCSVVRMSTHVAELYVKELINQVPVYKQQGIDEVYLINSCSGLFALARSEKLFPEIVMLADTNNQFVTWISSTVNKATQTIDNLSKYWSYQVLLNNSKVEQFYEQPTENYIRHLIKAGHRPSLTYQKFFITEGDEVALHRPVLSREEQNSFGHLLFDGARCTPLEFMYFNLCPNTKLNQYLLDTQV